VTAGSGAANRCPGPLPRLHVAAEAWLEPAPLSTLDTFGGSQYAPATGGNVGVGVGFAELSAGIKGFCIGVLYRAELEGSASRDVLDILHADRHGKPFDAGRTYWAQYDTSLLKAHGLRVRRAFDFRARSFRMTVGLGASLLQATQGRQESLNGTLTAATTDYATGTATWLRAASDLDPAEFNPFVGAGDPRGWGFSTDLHLKALIRERTEVDLVVMDLVGQIYWHDLRRSLRRLDNATIRYDENANRKAFVNGVDSRIADRQRIPTKYHLAIAQPFGSRLKVLLADDSVGGIHFVSLGVRLGSAERSASATFDLRTHAVGLSARWAPVAVSLTTNRWRLNEASALGASVEIAAQW
jgi:hypothetical protein